MSTSAPEVKTSGSSSPLALFSGSTQPPVKARKTLVMLRTSATSISADTNPDPQRAVDGTWCASF